MLEILKSSQICNLPELFGIGHTNPLHINPLTQLIIIFVLVFAMAIFNFNIRRRGKSQLYPILYALLGLSLLSIFYYCFQSDPLPEGVASQFGMGWFYDKTVVGTFWHFITIIALIGVIYFLQCAIMQATAEISVHAGLSDGKKWKEWKWAMIITMLGIAITCGCNLARTHATNWIILFTFIILFLFCFGKIIADSLRGTSVWRCILIGIIFFIGLVAIMMLTLECVRATFIAFIVCLVLFSTAKASKKQPKKRD